MKSIKKATLAISLLGVIATSLAFAQHGDDSISAAPTTPAVPAAPVIGTPPPVSPVPEGDRQRGGIQGYFFIHFMRTDLTATERTTRDSLLKAHESAVSTFLASNSLTDASAQSQYLQLFRDFYTSLTPFVRPETVPDFKIFITNLQIGQIMPKQGGSGGGPMGDNRTGSGETVRDNRTGSGGTMHTNRPGQDDKNSRSGTGTRLPNSKPVQSILPASLIKALDAKIATFPDDASKITWLTAVNVKIDALAAKVSAQKSKDILAALKNLINERIDALNGNTVDTTTLGNLLQ